MTKPTIIWHVPNTVTKETLEAAEALIMNYETNWNFSIEFAYSFFPTPQFHHFNRRGIEVMAAFNLQDKISELLKQY